MVWKLAVDTLTVKVKRVVPPVHTSSLPSLIEMVGCPSSLTIVPAPWLSLIVALTGFERLTIGGALGWKFVSALAVTMTGWHGTRGRQVSVPVGATYPRSGSVAVRSRAAWLA